MLLSHLNWAYAFSLVQTARVRSSLIQPPGFTCVNHLPRHLHIHSIKLTDIYLSMHSFHQCTHSHNQTSIYHRHPSMQLLKTQSLIYAFLNIKGVVQLTTACLINQYLLVYIAESQVHRDLVGLQACANSPKKYSSSSTG